LANWAGSIEKEEHHSLWFFASGGQERFRFAGDRVGQGGIDQLDAQGGLNRGCIGKGQAQKGDI
jgi:hypothetical protein